MSVRFFSSSPARLSNSSSLELALGVLQTGINVASVSLAREGFEIIAVNGPYASISPPDSGGEQSVIYTASVFYKPSKNST